MHMNYTVHFAQSAIPKFGEMGLKETIVGRGSGTYNYASEITNIKSQFSSYADFETILNGAPGMKVSLVPAGVYMKGSIIVTSLYNAKLTNHNLFGIVGGYSTKGSVTIEYQHPTRGTLTATYNFDQARSLMKTVAGNSSEKQPRPPASEWDESSPGYTRAAKQLAATC